MRRIPRKRKKRLKFIMRWIKRGELVQGSELLAQHLRDMELEVMKQYGVPKEVLTYWYDREVRRYSAVRSEALGKALRKNNF